MFDSQKYWTYYSAPTVTYIRNKIKVSGNWKSAIPKMVKVNGVWKEIIDGKIKVAGNWKSLTKS
jgi:hypothetical protein